MVIAEARPGRVIGRSMRAPYRASRRRKLTSAQEAGIRVLTGIRSLSALAAKFVVSHETVRAVCRRIGQAA